MFPVSDVIPSRTTPYVTISLIALNAIAFLIEFQLSDAGLHRLVLTYGVVPARFTWPDVLTSMFLHGGWLHFLGNMLYLWIFGDNVEDRMGHLRYLVFYLLTGWTATYAHIWSDPRSAMPSIGASGAIAGVLGAYITLYPRARVVMLLPLGIFMELIQVPAVLFLGFWFLQQFLFGLLSPAGPGEGGGVAWWAH